MKRRIKSTPLDLLGLFFLIFGTISISNAIVSTEPAQIFFLCYIALIIIGIAILTRNSYAIMSQLYIIAVPQILWTIDLIYQLSMNQPLLGLSDYLFTPRFPLLGIIISAQHIFTIPAALYAVKKIGLKRKDAWKISYIQITIIYILVSFLAITNTNINCISRPCIDINLGLPHWLTWFLAIFLMTYFTSIVLNRLVGKRD